MDRNKNIAKAQDGNIEWDIVVIGGGASGLGIALDGLSRGLSVLLLEKHDFAKGTSSRSTKLLHGGVRYLAQGDLQLVLEALRERGRIMKNAPHVSRRQAFIIPLYSLWGQIKYGLGLKIYDLMAGKLRIGRSTLLSRKATLEQLPNVNPKGLKGGVKYYDGQFDDARLAINVAQTCDEMGGCLLNYASVSALLKDADGQVTGCRATDELSGQPFEVRGKAIVNATGVFADQVLRMDQPSARKSIVPSQGIHLTLDLSFLGSQQALMIPQTSDGRVLFGIPWHGQLIVGTTDTLVEQPSLEPEALEKEIRFILDTCAQYLVRPPKRSDVKAVFAGLRPLAAPKAEGASTKEISRSHKITLSESGLFSLIGGKWTTFRQMGEDTIDRIIQERGWNGAAGSQSASRAIHGHTTGDGRVPDGHWAVYGSDAAQIKALSKALQDGGQLLAQGYPYTKAEVVWMARHEMAIRVEDVLARRTRLLFLDAAAALSAAPKVARWLAEEQGQGPVWEEQEVLSFAQTAAAYQLNGRGKTS